ncbi:hypothetical protein [Anaerospora sp.]|uniref:hypothetical protein n=1 Tax=Anaerospora sp. TaxID=1960278 RepID=UPI0028A15699|nr:hypothetical protein [Anaerospora sp.]
MNTGVFYQREKKVDLMVNDITQTYRLIALSAKEHEAAMADARRTHKNAIHLLAEAAETVKALYLLQDIELIVNEIIEMEQDAILAKAALTLVDDDVHYHEKLEKKSTLLKDTRRKDLAAFNKEQLVEKLVSMDIARQIHTAWTLSVLEALLAKALHSEARQRLFNSVEEMKTTLSVEVLEKFYEAQLEFITDMGNAQVFLKPHISVS